MDEFVKITGEILKLFEVSESPQTYLVLFFLTFARFISFIWTAPFIGGKDVPKQVKISAATALVIISYPTLLSELSVNQNSIDFGVVTFFGLLAKEIFVGFTLGFISSLVFESAQIAGRLTEYQSGAALRELYSPHISSNLSHLGKFNFQLAIVLFVTTGAHNYFIISIIRSYELIPALKFLNIEAGWTNSVEFLVLFSGSILSIGVQLAVPVIITLLVADLLFGLINRAVPQINVFFLSMSVKMWTAIFALLIILPFLIERFRELFSISFKSFEYFIQQFSKML